MLESLTGHGASHDWNSCCGCRPESYTKWQNLSPSSFGNDVTTRYLSQHVAKKEAGLHQARHCGAPAKVFRHWDDSNAYVDFILQETAWSVKQYSMQCHTISVMREDQPAAQLCQK